eukprot:1145275-Pelagomonas_calceolata.AAC.2
MPKKDVKLVCEGPASTHVKAQFLAAQFDVVLKGRDCVFSEGVMNASFTPNTCGYTTSNTHIPCSMQAALNQAAKIREERRLEQERLAESKRLSWKDKVSTCWEGKVGQEGTSKRKGQNQSKVELEGQNQNKFELVGQGKQAEKERPPCAEYALLNP